MGEPTESLMDRCKHADTEAFREIVERHQGYAFALAFRILCENEEAKDVVQESFIRVWAHRADYRTEMKFTTWLYAIVVHLSVDLLRARQRRERIFLRAGESVECSGRAEANDPAVQAGNRDLAEQIRRIAENLPAKQRIVFTLRDLQDQTVEEVAAIAGISVGSVRSHLCSARAAIRMKLQGTKKE